MVYSAPRWFLGAGGGAVEHTIVWAALYRSDIRPAAWCLFLSIHC